MAAALGRGAIGFGVAVLVGAVALWLVLSVLVFTEPCTQAGGCDRGWTVVALVLFVALGAILFGGLLFVPFLLVFMALARFDFVNAVNCVIFGALLFPAVMIVMEWMGAIPEGELALGDSLRLGDGGPFILMVGAAFGLVVWLTDRRLRMRGFGS